MFEPQTVSKRRKAKGDFHDWSVFAPDNEESERDTEFVPGMPVYTRGKLYDTHLHACSEDTCFLNCHMYAHHLVQRTWRSEEHTSESQALLRTTYAESSL